MIIANPIYDIVFKYLMEDERIAKTILSALLKREVEEVHVRRNEYSNSSRDSLSVFRIDFGATVVEPDGSRHLVLIELQKTWLETETLRFRQYLGVHYANPENILPESKEGFAIPMVAVYLLGHKVGDIEEPVLYVRQQAYDYNDRVVTKGLPNPFVDSLTHESIIVQIPRLHGQVNNRLDRVLTIFDQSQATTPDKHVLNIDDSLFAGDGDMMLIAHRLLAAAADSQMRHEMNVEDEYFSAIEKRDTDILLKDKKIAEQNATIREQEAAIKEQEAAIKEQEAAIKEQEAAIKEQEATIKDKEATIKDKEATIKDKEAAIKEHEAAIKEKETMLRTTVRLLLGAGMTPEQIAGHLNVSLDMVEQMT